ncbi:pentatricopeptide repeat-containing protein At1g11290, chloroplastic-like [Rhodamnia argentea]|uniref:Pentatricopeptide repeat-containing protein At1g11290, chloroplastic-like n=1 Tax=Rhodamnia argentea TaxID=178133 RepID=A0A8B8PJH3_9MYRT|nr:pentatricopeptide repeat-containing protein At1g11290, chloroplastic-like [Rhodamnia argentea]
MKAAAKSWLNSGPPHGKSGHLQFRIAPSLLQCCSAQRSQLCHALFSTVEISGDSQAYHPHDHSIALDRTEQVHAFWIKTHFARIHSHTRRVSAAVHRPQSDPAAHVNFLVTSYIKNSSPEAAISVYAHARGAGYELDCFTIPSVLKACGHVSCLQVGKEIHGFSTKCGFDSDVFVLNSMVSMYGECGHVALARFLFDEMPNRDAVTWSVMIRCYSHNGLVEKALELVKEMHIVNVKPNEAALVNMANLFKDLGNVEMAKAMHAYAIRTATSGCSDENMGVMLSTALIDMHAQCRNLAFAHMLFDRLTQKNIVAWTVMISGYIRCCKFREGADLFKTMLEEGLLPNEVTLLSLIIECGSVKALQLGMQIHAYICRHCLGISSAVSAGLIDMYGKCSNTKYARALFDHIENRDFFTWSAMVSTYARAAFLDQAFYCFVLMRAEGLRPDRETVVNILLACAGTGTFALGRRIHAYLNKCGMNDVILKTALVDMYAKCGDVVVARMLFAAAIDQDICMWNAMIGGYGKHGCGKEALELFRQMEELCMKPNDMTYIVVLQACGHAGLVGEGKRVFHELVNSRVLVPKIEHYGCMVDLLGRAGLLDEAYEVIKSMPIKPNCIVWGALYAASKLFKNTKMEKLASKQITDMGHRSSGYEVLLSNMFAAANRWSDVEEGRRRMTNSIIKKEAGVSMIEVAIRG